MSTTGIHHVTAIAGDAGTNYNFYAGILGLRLVKKTINFDDPETYHFYYGDGLGTPGTLLTFFPWSANAQKGRGGVHQANLISLAIPTSSLGYWTHRLMENGIKFTGPSERNNSRVLSFQDPDDIALELVTVDTPPANVQPWKDAPVPTEYAIRGIHSVQLWVLESKGTLDLLQKLGYDILSTDGNTTLLTPKTGFGLIEVRATGQFLAARGGVGTIHHIAFRVPDDEVQADMRKLVLHESISATTVQDRQYFRSIYFREPGGVLFEIATDIPGFATDESVQHLGEALKLPSYLEPQREYLESVLPRLEPTRTQIEAGSPKLEMK
jgi:glyoxalase family protein